MENTAETKQSDGFIYNEDGELEAYVGTSKNLTIPKDIEKLPSKFFKKNDFLEEVSIPASVNYIGNDCFKGCKNLKKVTISADINTIPLGCFANCRNLETITIISPIRKVGAWSFSNCEKLKEITLNIGVRSIGDFAFDGCVNLTEVKEMNGVSVIGNCAFRNTNLTELQLIKTKSIGGYAFSNTKIKKLIIPDSCISIKVGAFAKCKELENVIIKASFPLFEYGVFAECDKLTSVLFDDVVSVTGIMPFVKMKNLENVVVTKDSKPFIGFMGMFGKSSALKEPNGKLPFNVGLHASSDGSGAFVLTKGIKHLNEKNNLNGLNNCMRYFKNQNDKSYNSIKNRILQLSAMCCTNKVEILTDYNDFLFVYEYCKTTDRLDYYIQICDASKENLTTEMIFDLTQVVEEREVNEYLLSLIGMDSLTKENTHNFENEDYSEEDLTEYDKQHIQDIVNRAKEENRKNFNNNNRDNVSVTKINEINSNNKPISNTEIIVYTPEETTVTNKNNTVEVLIDDTVNSAIKGAVKGGVKGVLINAGVTAGKGILTGLANGTIRIALPPPKDKNKDSDNSNNNNVIENPKAKQYYLDKSAKDLKYISLDSNTLLKLKAGITIDEISFKEMSSKNTFYYLLDNQGFINPVYFNCTKNKLNSNYKSIAHYDVLFDASEDVLIGKQEVKRYEPFTLEVVDNKIILKQRGKIE